jgi:hypothetical protein
MEGWPVVESLWKYSAEGHNLNFCIKIESFNHIKRRKSVSTLLPSVPLFPEDRFIFAGSQASSVCPSGKDSGY